MTFPIVIRQVQLPARVVVLNGRSLPYQGVSWSGEQRLNTKWMPGNPVAVTHVLGPTFTDTTMSGTWKDIFLSDLKNAALLANFPALAAPARLGSLQRGGNTFESIGSIPSQLAQKARVLRDAFILMRKEGILLKVEWGSIVRYGFLKRSEATHDREEDIQWELVFEWIGETDAQPKRLLPKIELLSALRALLAVLDKVLNTLLSAVIKAFLFLTKITQFITKIASFITTLLEVLAKLQSLIFVPADLLSILRANLTSILLAARDLFDTFAVDASAAYESSLFGNPKDIIEANIFQYQVRQEVTLAAAEAADKKRQIEEFAGPELLGLYTAKGGESLRDVSKQFYNGDPSRWRAIAEFNGIDRAILVRGTIVRLPRFE